MMLRSVLTRLVHLNGRYLHAKCYISHVSWLAKHSKLYKEERLRTLTFVFINTKMLTLDANKITC